MHELRFVDARKTSHLSSFECVMSCYWPDALHAVATVSGNSADPAEGLMAVYPPDIEIAKVARELAYSTSGELRMADSSGSAESRRGTRLAAAFRRSCSACGHARRDAHLTLYPYGNTELLYRYACLSDAHIK